VKESGFFRVRRISDTPIFIAMLSQTIEYALRATLYIARDHPRPVRVAQVASAVEAPRTYLAKILGSLARAGILESARGPAGGFRLGSRTIDVSLSDVVAVFEATHERRCLLGHGPCGQNPACTAHPRWAPIAKDLDQFFADTTLRDLLSSPRTLT
jgi:Rrf2 family protein